jgi:iron complex outermembrane receptor protein
MSNKSRNTRLLAALFVAAAASPLFAQTTAPAQSSTNQTGNQNDEEAVVLSPFEVRTEKDRGYAATNQISGSRVSTAIKDLPIPIDVVTSQLISDIGATDLRKSLSYTSGILLMTQNDLENTGGTYGSAYGPGGVNNPEGLTANIDNTQFKVRGFVTKNTLRDGFTRFVSSDSVNIDRVEVVYGPNALLYGTGNLGGVVDYLTKQPQNKQAGMVRATAGMYSFLRGDFDVTGPIVASQHFDYRVTGAVESSKTHIDYQKNSHVFLAPSFTWEPTATTKVSLDLEYLKSKSSGYGARAFRASAGNGATPINNDQLEATSFYYPPGANKRTVNLSGPDTYNNQTGRNLEIKVTQTILKEGDWVPSVDALVGYNRSETRFQTRDLNGQIAGPILAGNPGYNLSETIMTTVADNSIGGQGASNGNLVFGPLPNSVISYTWNRHNSDQDRDQERGELTLHKTLFNDKWYRLDDQLLVGASAIYNKSTDNNWSTNRGVFNYGRPLSLSPLHYGTQGDGKPDQPMFQDDLGNINKSWDTGLYLNNYAKLFNIAGHRVILMDGVRKDKLDQWGTNTTFNDQNSAPSTVTSRAMTVYGKSYQNGVIFEVTKNLSIYGLKAEGLEPNFNGLHNAITGQGVGANYAKSRELGLKFDLLDGKISGRLSHYTITKVAWVQLDWWNPTLSGGHPHFDPTKDIIYQLNSGGGGFLPTGADATFPGSNPFIWGPANNDPTIIAKFNAAVAAGQIYTIPGAPAGNVYADASKPLAAAYMDAVFQNLIANPNWAGWLYQGNSDNDPRINNATMDAAGFQNGSQNYANQKTDRSTGYEGELTFTPNDQLQVVFNFVFGAKIQRINNGQWVKYPYPQDRWAVWYFPNGGWGTFNQAASAVYTDPNDTSTRTTLLPPSDDTPKNSIAMFSNYKFAGSLKGLSVGAGGRWTSQRLYFNGITHGAGQLETNAAGQPFNVWTPSELTLNGMIKYEFKRGGHDQYVQLNVDNVLNDQRLYGFIYKAPINAKLTYGFAF